MEAPPQSPALSAELWEAAKKGQEAEVERLLAAGADTQWANPGDDDSTALITASHNGHDAVVERLLAAGSDVNHQVRRPPRLSLSSLTRTPRRETTATQV